MNRQPNKPNFDMTVIAALLVPTTLLVAAIAARHQATSNLSERVEKTSAGAPCCTVLQNSRDAATENFRLNTVIHRVGNRLEALRDLQAQPHANQEFTKEIAAAMEWIKDEGLLSVSLAAEFDKALWKADGCVNDLQANAGCAEGSQDLWQRFGSSVMKDAQELCERWQEVAAQLHRFVEVIEDKAATTSDTVRQFETLRSSLAKIGDTERSVLIFQTAREALNGRAYDGQCRLCCI